MKTTIPAQPGFYLLEFVDSEPPCFDPYPIIAWIIEDDVEDGEYTTAIAHPVTHEWNCNRAGNLIIRRPSGVIDFVGDQCFAKEEDAVAYAVERRQNRAA
jgi:hypothetical protein